jgi:hypothetical protein
LLLLFVLHKYDKFQKGYITIRPPFVWFYFLPCVQKGKVPHGHAWQILDSDFHSRYGFYFVHLQLAMQRFYRGPRFGITTESLSYTEVKEYEDSRTLFSTEAQICPSGGGLPMSQTHPGLTQFKSHNLCLRIQATMLVAREDLHLFLSDEVLGPIVVFYICEHISHTTFLESMVNSYGEEPIDYHIAATCKRCNTDYELQLVESGQEELALVMTRWINLGPGLNPHDQSPHIPVPNAETTLLGYKDPISESSAVV